MEFIKALQKLSLRDKKTVPKKLWDDIFLQHSNDI